MNKLLGYIVASLLLTWQVNANATLTCVSGDITSTWKVGYPYYGAGEAPDYCTATGQELDYIRATFTGLRNRKGNNQGGYSTESVTWFGDDALFLVNNL